MSSLQENSNRGTYFMMEELDIHPIDSVEMTLAQSVVDSVNQIVYNQLKTKLLQFKLRSTEPLVLQGSVADGTKVLKPDEFDYLIPMDLCCYCWDIEKFNDFSENFYNILQRYDHEHQLSKECIYRRNNVIRDYIDRKLDKDARDLRPFCKTLQKC